MAKFTLLEIHLDESTLTANAPYSGRDEAEDGEDDYTAASEGSGGRGKAAGLALVVLAVLAVVAVVLRRVIGGGDSEELGPIDPPAGG
jgi:hypothetical protein